MNERPCFGIDLGTTASAIGWVRDGVPTLIPVDGAVLVPSVVRFDDDGTTVVGTPARNTLPLAPERTVTSAKRYMGSEHTFSVGARRVTPVEAAEQVLRVLVDGAERHTGVRPERVVITVPAWFTQAQRSDTRVAGERAGLTVERILNEPTAAALAHAHGQEIRRRALVYDLGGGTFDVSLVEQDGPLVEVLASHGDSRLGGDDIDAALVDFVLRRIAETDRDLREAIDASIAARVRLRLAAEAAKIELSEQTEARIRVPFLVELHGQPRHLDLPLSRDDLDLVSWPFLARTLVSVDQVLQDAGVSPGDLDELLLVGGATLQPRVWHLLHDRYGLEGSHAIAPRDVVALGAAIQAAIVDGSRTDGILVDVAPYSISVGVGTGALPGLLTHYVCRVITPRNAPLPSRHAEVFHTVDREQTTVRMFVFQGSSPDPRRNAVLGEFEIDELPPAPGTDHSRPVRVEFRHDVNGMVQIEVTDALSGRSVRGEIAADGAHQEDIRGRMEQEALECGLILGDGSEDGDDRSEDEEGIEESGPLDEAREAFAGVLAAEERLTRDHGADGVALASLARTGAAAFADGRDADALATYESLADRLFALGIYL